MFAKTTLPVSMGSLDMIVVYCTQTAMRTAKSNTNAMMRELISSGVAGGCVMRVSAPMERVSPNIRSDRLSILALEIGPRGFSSLCSCSALGKEEEVRGCGSFLS